MEVDSIPLRADEPGADAFCRAVYPRLAATLGLHCGEPALGEELAQGRGAGPRTLVGSGPRREATLPPGFTAADS